MRARGFLVLGAGLLLASAGRLEVLSDAAILGAGAPRPAEISSIARAASLRSPAPSQDLAENGETQLTSGAATDQGPSALREGAKPAFFAPDRTFTHRDPIPAGATLDPRDLRALADLIEANRLDESSSATDHDDGDGVLEPFELGTQSWRGGRLIALFTGEDRYDSFGYGLTVLPPSVGDLNALEELDLGTNRLKVLPDAIGELRSLRVLHVQRNELEALPESIGELRSLRELVIGENAVHELPQAIAGLSSLEELHANDNPIATLPEAIGLLPRLRVLNVSHVRAADSAVAASEVSGSGDAADVRLVELPRSIETLPSLETLHLAGNRLYCAGGAPDPGLAPERLRNGSIARLHGLLLQDCGVLATP